MVQQSVQCRFTLKLNLSQVAGPIMACPKACSMSAPFMMLFRKRRVGGSKAS